MSPAIPLLSNQLQSGFCLNCCSEIPYVQATNVLLTSTPDRHFSVLLLFRLPGTFGIIFFLNTEEASTAGYLPASSLLSLRPLCQLLPTLENSLFHSNHPASLPFIPCTFLSARRYWKDFPSAFHNAWFKGWKQKQKNSHCFFIDFQITWFRDFFWGRSLSPSCLSLLQSLLLLFP